MDNFMCLYAPGLPLDPHTTPGRPTPPPDMCGKSLEWSTTSPNAHTFAPGEVGQDEGGRNQSKAAVSQGALWFQSHCGSVRPTANTGQTGFWCLQASFLRAQTLAE